MKFKKFNSKWTKWIFGKKNYVKWIKVCKPWIIEHLIKKIIWWTKKIND